MKKSDMVETEFLNDGKVEELEVSFEDMVGNRPKLAKNYSFKLTIFGDTEKQIDCIEEIIFQNILSTQQELYEEYMQSNEEDTGSEDEDDDGEYKLF